MVDLRKENNKIFYKTMFAIALPIAIQNLITSSLNMIDTLMITSLGTSSVAGVGLANQVFFFFMLLIFGVNSGSAIFISQFWGKKDTSNIKRVLGLSILVSMFIGSIFTIGALFFPKLLISFFSDEYAIVDIGSRYIRIISLSYIITGISFSFSIASRSIGNAKLPMLISGISFLVNTVFNYLLIFGKFGFPELGVEGAAIATVFARIVELSVILYIIYKEKGPLAASFKEFFAWDKGFAKAYTSTTLPVIINEGFWALGQVMYSVAYAKIGENAIAGVQVATNVLNIFMVLTRGLSNAAAVMIGNKIGEGDKEAALDYSKRFLILVTIIGVFLGLVLILSSGIIIELFSGLTVEVQEIVQKMLIVMGILFFIKAFNGTVIVGLLRAGGDTKFSMILEMASVWLVGVPLAFIGALVLQLPVYWVVALVHLEEIVKLIFGISRIISKKWVRNITQM